MAISQYAKWLLYASVLGVEHYGSHCQQFRSQISNRIVGLLWHVFLLGKLVSKHTPTNHGNRHQSHHLGSLHAKLVIALHPLGRDILAAWCMVVGGGARRKRNRSRRRGFLLNSILSINWSWWPSLSYYCHEPPLPATKHKTINKHTMQHVCILKTRKLIIVNVYLCWCTRLPAMA